MSLLILSGFEANGMAGLLADDRLAADLQVPRAVIATGQTAQTPTSLMHASAADPTVLEQQLASLSFVPTAVKIGVVFNRQTADVLANWLSRQTKTPAVVLDTVNLSSSDRGEFSREALSERLAPLLPWVSVLTPNVDECHALTSQHEPAKALQALRDRFDFHGALLLTGGHSLAESDDRVIDFLQTHVSASPWVFRQPRLRKPLRGSGCRLSTAIACALAKGYGLADACTLGNAVLHRYWRLTPNETSSGWPISVMDYPDVSHAGTCPQHQLTFPALDWPAGLYPVVDSAEWVERLAGTGVRTVQLRIKQASHTELTRQIQKAVAIAEAHNLQLFINDYWQLAIELGAFGVHLGQEDLADADLSAIANAGLRLGISTHGDAELMRARGLRPSYLAVGAIFPTQTKDMSNQIQGIERLRRYVRLCKGTPVVAIGGINGKNLMEVLETTVPMVAVVSAITDAPEPEEQAQSLNQQILAQ